MHQDPAAQFFFAPLRSLHATQAEVETHSEVYTPLSMPIIRGKAKVKMLSRPYSLETTHITPSAITVVTVVMMVRRADWLTEWLTSSSKLAFLPSRLRFSRMRS